MTYAIRCDPQNTLYMSCSVPIATRTTSTSMQFFLIAAVPEMDWLPSLHFHSYDIMEYFTVRWYNSLMRRVGADCLSSWFLNTCRQCIYKRLFTTHWSDTLVHKTVDFLPARTGNEVITMRAVRNSVPRSFTIWFCELKQEGILFSHYIGPKAHNIFLGCADQFLRWPQSMLYAGPSVWNHVR